MTALPNWKRTSVRLVICSSWTLCHTENLPDPTLGELIASCQQLHMFAPTVVCPNALTPLCSFATLRALPRLRHIAPLATPVLPGVTFNGLGHILWYVCLFPYALEDVDDQIWLTHGSPTGCEIAATAAGCST